MIFTKIRTLAKRLTQMLGKLKTYLKLAETYKKYVIQVLDLEEKIAHLQRVQRSFEGMEIVDVVEGDHFVVKSKANFYIVRPLHFAPNQRCDCGDCYYRGKKCKHQILVERFCQVPEVQRLLGINSRLVGDSLFPIPNT